MYTIRLISEGGEVKYEIDLPSQTYHNMLRVNTVITTLTSNIKYVSGNELHGMEGFVIEGSDTIEITHKN
jgi:hypothetical protein